ncbi:transmembrane protein, putative (macronuclear) [Tetrahymena thermophila SB210]|uniref:Transmembrane protein, putative n=1 Tax=Tetrahymena thermophila (strain SB210) TaxID=312017 RepID=W7X9Z1_TETTS|nr:transmembrane protein, putative [Tetrahymena thermophila SB210]EWS73213.1 transmembrane protein, putative [Tetrahymena thermophila SB210]|eukprot:XP_012654245.1 transmembrane protein, putative [Tetrahymena thermophila SB210]
MRNTSLTNDILYLMQRFLFVPFLMNNGYVSQYQDLFYFSSSFIIILIMSFASSSLLIEKNGSANQKLKSSHKIIFCALDFTVNTLTQVLYIPFFQLFASIFQCEKNSNYKYSSTFSQDTYFDVVTKDECFSVIKISSIIISIVCMAVLHLFCSYINQVYYDPRLDCTYKNSKLSGDYELSIQYFVTSFCIVASLLFEDRYQVIEITMSVVWWFYLLKLLLNNMLHNFNILQKIKLQQAFIIFLTTVIGVYNYFFPGSTVVAFFWIVGIIFFTIFNIYFEPVTNEICAANSFNHKYAQDALQQLRVLCYAIQKYDQYSIKVDGFLNRHRNDCIEPSCPSRCNSVRIKKISRMLVNQTTNEDLIMSISVIYTIFHSNIEKFAGSNKIRILYALFLFETIQNKDQSLIQLSFVSQNQPTLQEEFMSYRLRKIIVQQSNQNEYKSKLFFYQKGKDFNIQTYKQILRLIYYQFELETHQF